MQTTSSSSSSTSSAPQVTPTEASPSFTCPGSNGATVTENGQSYVVGCSAYVQGTSTSVYAVSNSWNDCFGYCDASTGCTGFTYNGTANGAGPGTCYLRTATTQGFLASDTYHVGAILSANYVAIYTVSCRVDLAVLEKSLTKSLDRLQRRTSNVRTTGFGSLMMA